MPQVSQMTPQEIESEVKKIYQSLDSAMRAEPGISTFQLTGNEIPHPNDPNGEPAMNEGRAHKRLQKISILQRLDTHWDAFNEKYKGDPLMDRFRMELDKGGFDFDAQTLQKISSYPSISGPKYYFNKNQNIDVSKFEDMSFPKLKEKFMDGQEDKARLMNEQRDTLIKQWNSVRENETNNARTMNKLSVEDGGPINKPWDETPGLIGEAIRHGKFKTQTVGTTVLVEVPLEGKRPDGQSTKTSVISMTGKKYGVMAGSISDISDMSPEGLEKAMPNLAVESMSAAQIMSFSSRLAERRAAANGAKIAPPTTSASAMKM